MIALFSLKSPTFIRQENINNIKTPNRMKKRLLLLGLLALSSNLFAADTLSVRAPQIPLLTNQRDNILFEIRIDADKGDVMNELALQFDEGTQLSNIEAVRLFYSGTEAVSREGEHFSPTYYIVHRKNEMSEANRDYSIKQDEAKEIEPQLKLKSNQPLIEGTNYFWVSLQMKRTTPLKEKIAAQIQYAKINKENAIIEGDARTPQRRMAWAVRQAWDDGIAAFRIPGIVTTKKGTLISCYDVRYNTSVDLQEKIDIGISRSQDKGKTWEPMQIAMTMDTQGGLPHAQNGVGDPCILVDDQTNTIWIAAAWCHGMGNQRAWFNSQQGMSPDKTGQLLLVKSEDDGKTWSKPINITAQVKDPSWYFLLQGPGRGITMKDGTLVFPIQFIDSTRVPNAGIMYSKDKGKTWKLHNAARSNTTESQVVEIEPGVLMLNMRDNRGGSRAVSITKDLGMTWEEHPSNRSALPEPVCMASLIHVDADKNCLGKDILLFSNPNSTKHRDYITVKASLDGGLTWPNEYQVLLDEGTGWGYTCLTMIDEETVGILYESSVAHMTFQVIPLKEIIK